MTEHPITPPPELVEQWANASARTYRENGTYAEHEFALATQAARWGADQELEACCEWVSTVRACWMRPESLRSARRPKPPSKKERALKALSQIEDQFLSAELAAEIRCALEELPND